MPSSRSSRAIEAHGDRAHRAHRQRRPVPRAPPRRDGGGDARAEAVAHPNWRMGAKISVDSATMMNKGLEVIEAHHLFALASERIEIVVHPQSVVHGLVYYSDGSVLAQLGSPDMRTPIANALGWPRSHRRRRARASIWRKLGAAHLRAARSRALPGAASRARGARRRRRRAHRAQRRQRGRGRRLSREPRRISRHRRHRRGARWRRCPTAASTISTTSTPCDEEARRWRPGIVGNGARRVSA